MKGSNAETLPWDPESGTLHLPQRCPEVANYVAGGMP